MRNLQFKYFLFILFCSLILGSCRSSESISFFLAKPEKTRSQTPNSNTEAKLTNINYQPELHLETVAEITKKVHYALNSQTASSEENNLKPAINLKEATPAFKDSEPVSTIIKTHRDEPEKARNSKHSGIFQAAGFFLLIVGLFFLIIGLSFSSILPVIGASLVVIGFTIAIIASLRKKASLRP